MDGVTNLAESADGWKNAQSGRSVDAPCVLMGSSRIAANKCRSTLPPSLENRDLRLWILPRAARPGNGGHGRIDIDQPHGRMVRKQVSTATGAPLTMTDRGLVVGGATSPKPRSAAPSGSWWGHRQARGASTTEKVASA